MSKKLNTLYALGCLCLGAVSLAHGEVSSKGLAQCGGLFLLDSKSQQLHGTSCQATDTTRAGKYSVFAGFEFFNINGLWVDGWALSLKSNRTLGSAGVQADFQNIAFSVKASTAPAITARLTAHTGDSAFYATTTLERGAPELATFRWESANREDEVNLIEAKWESQYLRKGIAAGANFAGNSLTAGFEQIRTTPHNAEREYFIKDSSRVWLWNVGYRRNFEKNKLEANYIGTFADAHLYGNTYRDSSTKRFMYLPLEGTLHYANVSLDKRLFGFEAHGLKANIDMEKNTKRFFETFAPNRLLPVSLTQTLSFSFLQKNYLVDADLDLSAVTFGGHIAPTIHLTWNTRIVPRIDFHGYYTYNEIDIGKTSETTSFIAYKATDEQWRWTLESIGAIAGIGLALESESSESHGIRAFEWSASQIIPIKTDFAKHSKKDGDGTADPAYSKTKDPAGSKPSGIFKNGFATSLALRFSF